jgi:hypothetical protein
MTWVGSTLIGGSGHATGELYAIDPVAADLTLINATNYVIHSLAYDDDNNILYAGSPNFGSPVLLEINPTTGVVNNITSLSVNIEGMVYHNGTLYGGNGLTLYSIDPATGTASALGSGSYNIYAMAVVGDILYGAGFSSIFEISTSSGAHSLIGSSVTYSTEAMAPFDHCPSDPDKFDPGVCGCGVPDTDSDLDTIPDCIDNCPDDPNTDQLDTDYTEYNADDGNLPQNSPPSSPLWSNITHPSLTINSVNESVTSGILSVNVDYSLPSGECTLCHPVPATYGGGNIYWQYHYERDDANLSDAAPITIEARLKNSGDIMAIGISNGAYREMLFIKTGGLKLGYSGPFSTNQYNMVTTDGFHTYELILDGSNVSVYVDDALITFPGTLGTPESTTEKKIRFGIAGHAGTSATYGEFDYVIYSSTSTSDGVGNVCDNCPNTYNPFQTDTDTDGEGDVCDPEFLDDDGDGYTEYEGDCDDINGNVNPGETEVPYNGKDDDCNPATLDYNDPQREALKDLYNSTNGDSWSNNAGWKDPPLEIDGFATLGMECTWRGITCSASTVTRIILLLNNLNGTVPSSLDDLSSLQILDLSNNQLTGSIPPELGSLPNLQYLYLNSNQLSGSIPTELGNLSGLERLRLFNNQLSGNIPPELGNLSSLQILSMYENQFTGTIPDELGNLSNLQALYLRKNQLSGTIPSTLFAAGNFPSSPLSSKISQT